MGVVVALLGACGAAGPGGAGATGATGIPEVASPTRVTGPLAVSTPVPPAAVAGEAVAPTTAPLAREGQPGPTQRHPFVPTRLTLATRDAAPATTSVETIDTSPTGELTLPRDAGRVGWWQSGALAGDAYGSVVLAGHLDSRDTGLGFFVRLLTVGPDDEVVLDGGGYQQRYRVLATRNIPKASLATGTDTFSQSVPGRLVLLTCTGPFDPVTHYPDNLVVIAEPVGVPTTVP